LLYRAGLRGALNHASFHWPSTVSPLVDPELLALWRETSTDREFRTEVLAEWCDEAGQYFSAEELDAAVCDYELIPPVEAAGRLAVGGVDWGFARDSSALVLLALAGAEDLPGGWPARSFFVPYLMEGIGVPYATFVARVAACAGGYKLSRLASECNGVGAMPTQELSRLVSGRVGRVVAVTTTADSKQDGFGKVKLLLGQGRLALPRHPRLLSQLSALEFEERDSGTVRIEVPARMGHDDLCMALCLAAGESDTSSRSMPASAHAARGRLPATRIGRTEAGDARFLPGSGGRGGTAPAPSWVRRRSGGRVLRPGQYRPPEPG